MPSNHWPPQSPPVATSSAPATLVPVHVCPGCPVLLTGSTRVRTVVGSSSVASWPSTRTVTSAGPAAMAAGGAARQARTARRPAVRPVSIGEATPFHEGCSAWRAGGGLLASGHHPLRALPAQSPVAGGRRDRLRGAPPVTVAGPRRIRTGFPVHRPWFGRDSIGSP